VAFAFQDLFPLEPHPVPYRRIDGDFVREISAGGRTVLEVQPEALSRLAFEAFRDIEHLFRPDHLGALRTIVDDAEASSNDRFVAYTLLKNAVVSSGMVLPSCQDTGTAIVIGKKGQRVWTTGSDEEALSRGIYDLFQTTSLRYSQMAPLSTFREVNTKSNLPAQIELYATGGDSYDFLFVAKGGGSANKTFLFQETKAVLNPAGMKGFVEQALTKLGTAACPPYHLAVVIGGASAEQTLKTVKLASCRYLDTLPSEGNTLGHAIRDRELEREILEMSRTVGIGAQFGGKYFCHDVRVIRLPRHGASLPIGIGVSCSADRQALGSISAEGVFVEQLEADPARYMPDIDPGKLGDDVVHIDLSRPMNEIRATLSRYPIKTRLALTGPLVVARDIAHANLADRLAAGGGIPEYLKRHPVYYAGPAKTPEGYASGSFGPTTAARMDMYVDRFQAEGASLVMLAKGNRTPAVTLACKTHGGFYLGSIGGPAAVLARDNIRKVEVLDMEDLGMEAVWRIEVEDFPAFIVVDDKGNDFFRPKP
jgi:fumarate hydratase class I